MKNERIQALVEQAGIKMNCYGKPIPASLASNWELLVELIVKECAEAADQAHAARCDYPGDYVGEYMGYGQEQGVASWRCS